MSFPETPLFIYPSLAKRYGVEVSLLYGICYQLFRESWLDNQEGEQVVIGLKKWLSVTDFWQSDELQVLSQSLAEQQLFAIEYHQGDVYINKLAVKQSSSDERGTTDAINNTGTRYEQDKQWRDSATEHNEREQRSDQQSRSYADNSTDLEQLNESMQVLPVYDVPPAPPVRPLPRRQDAATSALHNTTLNESSSSNSSVLSSSLNNNSVSQNTANYSAEHNSTINNSILNSNTAVTNNGNTLKNKGPAPSFGGSTGWKKRSNDALQNIFEQQEVLNRQLQGMTMNWRPSKMFYKTLERNNISQEFADSYLDEFILFYCDKHKKESIGGWDQKYLAWVKRAWVQKQSNSQTSDSSVNNSPKKTGFSNENSQRDTREKRKRITAAIMDIHDTNW
ncbi:DnaT-like ssDNA-binding domain-containing protein [Gammaproteobacteria bacterium AS21]